MGGTCSMHGCWEMYTVLPLENVKGTDSLKVHCVYESLVLKLILKKSWSEGVGWTHWAHDGGCWVSRDRWVLVNMEMKFEFL